MSKVSSLVDCTDEEAVECLNDFCESIQQEMSVNGSIPFSIPVQSIAQITKNAKTMFYKMYSDATEEMYIAIPKEEILKKSFQKGVEKMKEEGDKEVTKNRRGAFLLPDGVVSVCGVYEISGWSGEAGWGTNLVGRYSGDMSLQRMLFQQIYQRETAVSADGLMYYICTESFLDISRQLFQNPISFNYNRLTNNLRFLGKLPINDVILDVLVRIDDCSLYNDDLFRRYVIADAKSQLGRILNSFSFNLPGGISINAEAIANEGSAEKDAIIQELKDIDSSWYIMTF